MHAHGCYIYFRNVSLILTFPLLSQLLRSWRSSISSCGKRETIVILTRASKTTEKKYCRCDWRQCLSSDPFPKRVQVKRKRKKKKARPKEHKKTEKIKEQAKKSVGGTAAKRPAAIYVWLLDSLGTNQERKRQKEREKEGNRSLT